MNKKPLTYASFAALYISCLVSGAYLISTFIGYTETILMPVSVLSLLVLSVALMGFLFFSEPLFLALDGKRPESVSFFLHTVGCFACYVALFGAGALVTSYF
jgi:4-hydroxybenzoate polyprenyltransferase